MSDLLRRCVNTAWRLAAGLLRPSGRANLRRLRRRGEHPGELRIRFATLADLEALAALHVTTWNATYAPFGARGPSVEIRAHQWRAAFEPEDPAWFCLVVERRDGALVGFAQANRSGNPRFEGELGKIHLLRDYQRLGLGRRLVGHVARHFLEMGITSMWLYGDPRNPSIAAWLAMGAEKTDRNPANGNFGWRDIRPLAAFPP